MELRSDARWSLAVPTSMGLRMVPKYQQPVHTVREFTVSVTSAETNVASVASHLGLPVKVLTNFVAGSPIAAIIKADLLSRGMSFEGQEVVPDGPWGVRHQINIADSGFGVRGPRVWNDRAGEVGRDLSIADFDVERLFQREGVKVLHLSDLISALSHESGELCLELADIARDNGTLVSFDLNYRASFWMGREQELASLFNAIAAKTDVLIGNEEDFQLALGASGPQSGNRDLAVQIPAFVDMIESLRSRFTQARWFATTIREVVDAGSHLWGAVLVADGQVQSVPPRPISVYDRIGGGDAFVGGLLYGLLRGWEPEKALQFAWASGAYTVTVATDYANITDEASIWSVWAGNARVQR